MKERRTVHGLRSILYSTRVAPYVFVLPFLLSFLIFYLYPTINTILMSFHRVEFGGWEFVGLDNFRHLDNVHFYNAVRTSTIYTALTIAVLIPIPMLIAVFLNSKAMVARNLYRSILFIPSLVSVIVAGVAFRLLFGNTRIAFVNSILVRFGIEPISWMLTHPTGMFLMVILASWRWAGVNMIYFLSGLQAIPVELYESADIDGASALQKFTGITLPLLKPIAIYVLTISIYGGYAMFTESYVYWNETNPGDIGLTMVRYIYQQGLLRNDFGFGSAIGLSLLLIVFGINIVQLKFFGLFRREQRV